MSKRLDIKEQLRRNTVALISLVVAITSLGYNTWRNEASEHNRNQRLVSIEVLRNLGELQQIVLDMHYGKKEDLASNSRAGWALVLTIHDLAMVLDEPLPTKAKWFKDEWSSRSSGLRNDDADERRILASLDVMREDIHGLLRDLD
ncbi:MAG: hypothetical protein QNJ14_12010 [Woeseiaceae bacterium]|nr:hypothetical protein [Woeseiaceae bacterium]